MEVEAKDENGRPFTTHLMEYILYFKKYDYKKGTIIPILYNPKKHKQAILEPSHYLPYLEEERKRKHRMLNTDAGD
ncbi:hypothetical protein [Pseudogracilibacillus auburnensis]|uniref:hypothetical protein n=1 Tax=Pseudogracilibacillus auburnensis TaxID=1494959 RepID=UPI001A9655A8|nr:hypothetical protein [Pseudogracilibacillus auburnensis]MBO1001926.1 hypothetical protein [Pseudogracilibacillus auburnensis]